MRAVVLGLVCAAAVGVMSPAIAKERETIGIGSEHYGHDWRKDRDEVKGRRSHCRIMTVRHEGELKRVKRCY